MIGGLQTGIALAAATQADIPQTATIIACTTFGSILPDIDQPNAKICREDYLAKAFSEIISSFTKHRRATHTIWFSFLFALLFYFLSIPIRNGSAIWFALLAFALVRTSRSRPIRAIASLVAIAVLLVTPLFEQYTTAVPDFTIEPLLVGISIFAGCIIHLIYDSFNPQGIQWLSPISRKRYSVGNIQVMGKSESAFALLMILVLLIEGVLYVRSNIMV